METKTIDKRIVSKGEYLAAKRLALCLSGAVLVCLIAIVLPPVSLPYICYLEAQEDAKAEADGGEYDPTFPYCSGGVVFGEACLLLPLLFATRFLRKQERKSWAELRELQPFACGYLPAVDSLVRASSKPTQAQETILLRAASEGHETPPEQLVRPAGGAE